MRNPFVLGAGGVVSSDIAVPEHERELSFYSSILTTGDAPLWRQDLMNNMGTPIIGLGLRTPEYESLPVQWFPHFQVSDVAASAEGALAMGGKELLHSKTDEGESQWACLSDPDGAAFGIIPAVDDGAYDIQQNPDCGRIAWLSLNVSDASASSDFYQRVLGWTAQPMEFEGGATGFEMQIDEENSAAQITQHQGSQDRIPSVWLIHLPVGNLSESLQRVKEGGGEVIMDLGQDAYTVIRDPVGVHFALQAG